MFANPMKHIKQFKKHFGSAYGLSWLLFVIFRNLDIFMSYFKVLGQLCKLINVIITIISIIILFLFDLVLVFYCKL